MISLDKPWNDVADQLRPAWPDLDAAEESDLRSVPDEDRIAEPAAVIEADPADVADQHHVVPLADDSDPWP
ncbi:hypothetical protein AB0M48_24305 [Lentzea sp. NPDC051208]|uniref:hypothetical protein n=1 Tax=Lentzea sp. NPDC051208 TaxID=3154642 RepID=UPI003443F0A7